MRTSKRASPDPTPTRISWCYDLLQEWCQSAEDGVLVIDEEGTIQGSNLQASRLFGYQQHDLIGRNVRHLFPILSAGIAENGHIRPVLMTHMVTGVHETGTSLPLEISITAFRHNNTPRFLLLTHSIANSIADDQRTVLAALSPREYQIVSLVVEGYTSREIAESLTISTKTVERHRANVMEKLGTSNVVRLVRLVMQEGLV
jgi:PAS domain S-box-containing protein